MSTYWTRFEWRGSAFYRAHLHRVHTAWQADPLFWVRVLLVLSSTATATALWWPNDMFARAAGYHYIRNMITENALGSVFCIHAVGLIWRLYAVRRRFAWTAFFGVVGMIVYFGVPICVYLDLGQITMAGISMMSLGAGCWLLVAKGPQFAGAE